MSPHITRNKLTPDGVRDIRKQMLNFPRSSGGAKVKRGYRERLAEEYGVHPTTIRDIMNGKRWSSVE
jgi:hypothetical protein